MRRQLFTLLFTVGCGSAVDEPPDLVVSNDRDAGHRDAGVRDAGTSDGGSPDAGVEDVVTRTIAPGATSPAILPTIGDHYVAVPPTSLRTERLFVFYPGTGASPDRYSMLLRRAAALGIHAIGLAYANTDAINFDVCPGQPRTCHEAARLEILLGTESGYSPPDVDADNSAFNRLGRLLEHLAATHPNEGWEAYLDGTEPRWARIGFGGHSQGGGHAAMTAKIRDVERALLFDATEPALWTMDPFTTPVGRLFGFAHTLESIYDPIVRSWAQIGLPGPIVSVDGADAPYGSSHRLSTSHADCSGNPMDRGYYHNCPVVDDYLPLMEDGTTPLFEPVWDHMLTTPVAN